MTLHRRSVLAMSAAAAAAPALPAFAQGARDAALTAAVAAAHRSASDKARDAHRHPLESLAFWGLRPGMTIVEIQPGDGYWTQILAPYAKATGGKYIATVGANAATADAFKARFANEAIYGKPEYVVYNMQAAQLVAPGSADMVLTARNIHNWMWVPNQLSEYLKEFNAALKPGGILAVEEHRADPRPMVTDARDGYVATAHVITEVQKAGFRLDAASELNANPKDKKDHPFGVWTLPPTRRNQQNGVVTPANFSREAFDAIGESDRMTLRFRKA